MGIPKIRTVDVDVGEIYVFQPGPVEVPGPATLPEPTTHPTRCAPNVHRIRELRLITAAQKLLRALLRHLGRPQVGAAFRSPGPSMGRRPRSLLAEERGRRPFFALRSPRRRWSEEHRLRSSSPSWSRLPVGPSRLSVRIRQGASQELRLGPGPSWGGPLAGLARGPLSRATGPATLLRRRQERTCSVAHFCALSRSPRTERLRRSKRKGMPGTRGAASVLAPRVLSRRGR